MKTLKQILFLLCLIAFVFSSCRKQNLEPDEPEQEQFIDNISYASDVVFIDNSMVDSATIVNDTTIIFYSMKSLTDNIHSGDKIVYQDERNSRNFFVGIVKYIEINGTEFVVHTMMPSIDDIFGNLDISPVLNNTNVKADFIPSQEDNVIFEGVVDNSVWNNIETVYSVSDSQQPIKSTKNVAATVPIKVTLKFSIKPCDAFDGNIFMRLEGSMFIHKDGSYEMSVKQIVGLEGNFTLAEQSTERKYVPLLTIKNPITLYSNKIVNVVLKPSLNFYYSGSIRLESGFKYEVMNADCYYSYENKEFSSFSIDNKKDVYFRVGSLHTDGEFGLSLNGDLYAFIFSENFFRGGAHIAAGVGIHGEKNVGIQFPDFANFDFPVSFVPFLELTPFVAIRTNKLNIYNGQTLTIACNHFKVNLLPNIRDINYKKAKSNISVDYEIDGVESSFMETKENGIALFKKDEEKPVSKQKSFVGNNKNVATFTLTEGVKYEISKYSTSKSGEVVYGERIPIREGLLIDRYEINADPKFYINSVKFEYDVYLHGIKDDLNDFISYGYYIRNSNEIEFHKISNIQNFNDTLHFHNSICLERNAFDQRNYSTYRAEATGYKIGSFAVSKNSNDTVFLDEVDFNDLVYAEKPKITFTQASLVTIAGILWENEVRLSSRLYADFQVEGAFWFTSVETIFDSDDGNIYIDDESPRTDLYDIFLTDTPNWFISVGVISRLETTFNCSIYMSMLLLNGNRINSTNSIVATGPTSNPSAVLSESNNMRLNIFKNK